MSDPVSLSYHLEGAGWARFRFCIGEAEVIVGPFGYCSDALGDLVRAALTIAASGLAADAGFDDEGQDWRLLLGPYWEETRKWTDFRVRALYSGPRTKFENEKIFEASCTPEAFAAAVLKEAQRFGMNSAPTVMTVCGAGPAAFRFAP